MSAQKNHLYRSYDGGRLYAGTYPTGSCYMVHVGDIVTGVNQTDGTPAKVFIAAAHVEHRLLPTPSELVVFGIW